jgi:Fe-S oxidoreductase
MLPEVGEATINVLRHNGADVQVLGNNCCGLPVYGYGDVEGARNLAKKNIDVLGDLDQYDYIVSECGSCSGHLKEYAELLADDSEYSVRAERLLEKVRSFSELLVEIEAEKPQGQVEATITYHDPCHMTARYQGVVAQPRELIKNVPGVEFKEMPEADWCCGAAGSYNIMHNDVSMKVLERKMGNVAKTEAEIVVTECPSCIMQLSMGARRQGLEIKVMNVSQLLDESYRRGESETFAKR